MVRNETIEPKTLKLITIYYKQRNKSMSNTKMKKKYT